MKLYAFGGACATSDAWELWVGAIVVFITHEVISYRPLL